MIRLQQSLAPSNFRPALFHKKYEHSVGQDDLPAGRVALLAGSGE